VRSIDDLAAKAAEAAGAAGCSVEEVLGGRPRFDAPFGELTWRRERQQGPFHHRSLELGVVLDDREVDGADLPRWDGTALDFVAIGGEGATEPLRAFTVAAEAAEFMRSIEVPAEPPAGYPAPTDPTPSFHVGGSPARYCEHINFAGAQVQLELAHALVDLTRVTMSGWWFWAVSWNDQISSVISGSGWSTLWEHVYPASFGYPPGSKLHDGPFGVIANLVPLGWNDRVSAINHHFFAE
jgi:hypothetical protein